jgi:hypothetical protein
VNPGPTIALLGIAFVLAGIDIGCAETAENAAVAPAELRGSAFGLLYTIASPAVAFTYLMAWMLIALATLGWAAQREKLSR